VGKAVKHEKKTKQSTIDLQIRSKFKVEPTKTPGRSFLTIRKRKTSIELFAEAFAPGQPLRDTTISDTRYLRIREY
jgi:hypothetical protein